VKLRIFGGPILHAAQRMQDGRVVPIIEETRGGAPLSAQDVVHRHAGSLRGRSKRRFRRMQERAELLPVAVIPIHPLMDRRAASFAAPLTIGMVAPR
jgi:hypothetical protein